MKIELKEIQIRDLFNGYVNNDEEGVYALSGNLNIRPKYQREFVYKDKQRDAVITTIRKGFPLNSMYWVKNGDKFEVLDGQQRTLSICEYLKGSFSINHQYQHNLQQDELDQILDYKLMIYICEGTSSEKLEWFNIINTVGEPLTKQELRNSVYTGTWLSDAKNYFSKTGCVAYNLSNKYVKGIPIRQDYLEIALEWIIDSQNLSTIEDYMAINQNKPNANELWIYFQSVINWVSTIFPNYYKEMKGLDWGILYNKYKDNEYDSGNLKSEIVKLFSDDDITKKSGIFEYLLSNKTVEKVLNIRSFTDSQKRTAFTKSNGVCPKCNQTFKIEEMEADHIIPWVSGGKTSMDNLQVICKNCNRTKSNR